MEEPIRPKIKASDLLKNFQEPSEIQKIYDFAEQHAAFMCNTCSYGNENQELSKIQHEYCWNAFVEYHLFLIEGGLELDCLIDVLETTD